MKIARNYKPINIVKAINLNPATRQNNFATVNRTGKMQVIKTSNWATVHDLKSTFQTLNPCLFWDQQLYFSSFPAIVLPVIFISRSSIRTHSLSFRKPLCLYQHGPWIGNLIRISTISGLSFSSRDSNLRTWDCES